MQDEQALLASAKRLVGDLHAFAQVAKAMENIGSLKQAAGEAETRLADLQKREEAIANLRKEAGQMQEEAAAALAKAHTDANQARHIGSEVLEKAQLEANTLIDIARKQAAEVVAQAKMDSAAQAHKLMTDTNAGLAGVHDQIANARNTLDELKAQVDDKRSAHAEITQHIETLKQRFR